MFCQKHMVRFFLRALFVPRWFPQSLREKESFRENGLKRVWFLPCGLPRFSGLKLLFMTDASPLGPGSSDDVFYLLFKDAIHLSTADTPRIVVR